MCFSIEALGKRLNPNAQGLGGCKDKLKALANESGLLGLDGEVEGSGKRFDAMFNALRDARNDIAHTGAYARHVAAEAVQICFVLEKALMSERVTVQDFMVTTPVVIQYWQSIGFARQLMILNSFSYLPIWHQEKWWLLSDIAVAKYLRSKSPAGKDAMRRVGDISEEFNLLQETYPVKATVLISSLLEGATQPGLWLVVRDGYPKCELAGVLSPSELM